MAGWRPTINRACEHPAAKRGAGQFGYDIGNGETRWFCFEPKWTDYRRLRYSDRPKSP